MQIIIVQFKSPWLLSMLLSLVTLPGCVSKSTADARARAAFMAGQQQAVQQSAISNQQAATMNRPSPIQGPTVTVLGEVKNNLVPWTIDLTLGKALVAADYYGKSDPTEILIQRGGQEIHWNPAKLLGGEDIQLQPSDVVMLRH